MPTRLRLACLWVLFATAARAWYEPGHRLVNQLALDALPPDFPGWVREPANAERIVFLAQEPDRWRRTPSLLLQHDNGLDHFINLEQLEDAGLDLATLTPFRYEFVAAYAAGRAAHPDRFPPVPAAKNRDHAAEWPGFLPWAIAEYYAKLQAQFSYLKVYERDGTPAEIANARANAVYVMGVMGHFVGDGSQPLHVTVQHAGWIGPNPRGYPTADFHALIDGAFIAKAGIGLPELVPQVRPARPFSVAARADGRDPAFAAVMAFLLETRATLDPMYRLVQANQLVDGGPGSRAGRDFIDGRLLAGGQMLAALWVTAWEQAAPDPLLRAALLRRPRPPAAP